jgi:hypothetical protein
VIPDAIIGRSVRRSGVAAALIENFGHTAEQARAIVLAKARRGGKMRAAKYARHAAPKGGTLR